VNINVVLYITIEHSCHIFIVFVFFDDLFCSILEFSYFDNLSLTQNIEVCVPFAILSNQAKSATLMNTNHIDMVLSSLCDVVNSVANRDFCDLSKFAFR
jgi:hypothetical protein